jgi:ABC-type amino acid transport system permease subunit
MRGINPMRTQTAQYLRNLPVWSSVAIWLTAFLSPTGYVLAVMTLYRLQMPAPPGRFVVALFCLIPLAALLVCWAVAWLSQVRRGWRVGWLVLTMLAMILQFGFWVVIILSAITAAISLP